VDDDDDDKDDDDVSKLCTERQPLGVKHRLNSTDVYIFSVPNSAISKPSGK
jgi:hypothetical protein